MWPSWGSLFHGVQVKKPWGSFLGGWINYSHILKNLPILTEWHDKDICLVMIAFNFLSYFFYKYFKSFFFALTILFLLSQTSIY